MVTRTVEPVSRQIRSELEDRIVADSAGHIELREQAEELRYLLAESPVVIYRAEPSGSYAATFVSDTVKGQLGYEPGQFTEEPGFWARHIHPQDAPRVLADRHLLLEQGRRVSEYRFRRRDGAYRWLRDEMKLVRDAAGNPVEILGCCVDITDRRQAEDEVEQSHAALHRQAAQLRALAVELTQAEQRERRRLAQILHDQLQQLLVAARLQIGLLRHDPKNEPVRGPLEQVDGLLDQAISESRSLTIELSPPVLHDAGLASGLGWLARWMEEKHALNVAVEADPQAETTDQDLRLLLFQAVRELLFNVVKHAGVDQASITAGRTAAGQIRIEVCDGGAGFDPSQAEARATGSGGFGLFNIRQRLESSGGRLEINSTCGQGTRAAIVVPGCPASAVAVTRIPAKRRRTRAETA